MHPDTGQANTSVDCTAHTDGDPARMVDYNVGRGGRVERQDVSTAKGETVKMYRRYDSTSIG
jgi:hypothetical protein